jgi:hypothetical protein
MLVLQKAVFLPNFVAKLLLKLLPVFNLGTLVESIFVAHTSDTAPYFIMSRRRIISRASRQHLLLELVRLHNVKAF